MFIGATPTGRMTRTRMRLPVDHYPFGGMPMSPPLARFLQRVSRFATAFHLWCAERELRAADSAQRTPALQARRTRNLDLLRDYRRRGDFPRNLVDPNRPTPCFVDSDDRRCAVAYLMEA